MPPNNSFKTGRHASHAAPQLKRCLSNMRLVPLIIFCISLSACEGDPVFKLIKWLSGTKTNTVIIVPHKVTLTPEQQRFTISEGAEVVGQTAAICMSLRGNFTQQKREAMEKEYLQLTGGTHFYAVIETADGRKVEFKNPGKSWSRNGVIEKENELSSCLNINCSKENLESGTLITAVSISASQPTDVRGIYWQSSNAWDRGN